MNYDVQELQYSKIREVKDLTRGTPGSAGIDFYIPDDFPTTTIFPLTVADNTKSNSILIPTGIKMNIPVGYVLVFFNKSGIATKKGLDILACVIDNDYIGEIHVHLVNTSNKSTEVNAGEKIAQAILWKNEYPSLLEVSPQLLFSSKDSTRGDGGFGSTN